MNDLKPCPFCGGKLNFYRENYVNLFGKRIIEQYWMHDDTDCVLNDINQPFVLGAGDANPEAGYPGEYAEKWNRRADEVHGWWDDSGRYTFPGGSTAVRCTNCGCALTESEYHLNNWNYCPVCGAKMDGGADHV